MRKRLLRLTPDHVAQVMATAGEIVAVPFASNRRPATEEDCLGIANEVLGAAPDLSELWVFAYGSLIWNPAFEFVEKRFAKGWRRSFCLGWDKWFRGSEQRPGLMLALDRGGSCNGVAYRLPTAAVEANLLSLLRREVRVIPHPFPARWITVATGGGGFRALTFAIDRNSDAYVGHLSVEEIADVLARRWAGGAQWPSTCSARTVTSSNSICAMRISGGFRNWWPSGSKLRRPPDAKSGNRRQCHDPSYASRSGRASARSRNRCRPARARGAARAAPAARACDSRDRQAAAGR